MVIMGVRAFIVFLLLVILATFTSSQSSDLSLKVTPNVLPGMYKVVELIQAILSSPNPSFNASPEELLALQGVVQQWQSFLSAPNPANAEAIINALISSPLIFRLVSSRNLADSQDLFGNSILILAARSGAIDILNTMLESGANVDLMDEHGSTSLIWAASNNQSEAVKVLLRHFPNVNIRNRNHGDSALTWAAYNGQTNIVQDLLAAGASVDLPNRYGNTPLLLASLGLGDRAAVVRLLLDKGADINHRNDFGESAVLYAAKNNHLASLQLLLRAGANPDYQDHEYGDTALGWAAALGHNDVVRELVAAEADLNLSNKNDVTPLLLATVKNRLGAAKLLMAAGADVNLKGNDGETALMRAVFYNLRDMIQLLLQYCPDLTLFNRNGKNIMQIASERLDQSVQQLIREHDSKTCIHDGQLFTVADTRYEDCRQLRCCHGNWTSTGLALPSCGQSCRTVGSPSGVCIVIAKCPTLLREYLTEGDARNTAITGRFVRNYGCGYTQENDLQVCCPVTEVSAVTTR